MPRIRAAIIDIDGTLLDSTKLIFSSWKLALKEEAGIDVSRKKLLSLQGISTERTIELLKVPKKKRKRVFDRYVSAITGRYEREARLFPGARSLLSFFRMKKIPIAILTAGRKEKAEQFVRKFDLGGFFKCVISTSGLSWGKETGRPFRIVLRNLRAKPGETVSIGDSIADTAGARKAGLISVALLSGGQPRNSLAKLKPDYILKDISKVKALLQKERLVY